eukprot:UN26434
MNLSWMVVLLACVVSENWSEFEILSESPLMHYYKNFLTPEQCEEIISLGKPKLEPSLIGNGAQDNNIRKSKYYF